MNEVTRARRVCAAAWHAAFSPTVEFWTEDKVGRPEASRSRHSACWNPNDAGSHPRLGHAALTAKVACRPGWHADGWMDGKSVAVAVAVAASTPRTAGREAEVNCDPETLAARWPTWEEDLESLGIVITREEKPTRLVFYGSLRQSQVVSSAAG
ncbi:hypothetical protein JHW43_000235 [Diplocarpon mali]|nr:hypothetical protein JHW43_000235 [Diplocarpon mali]